jgi:hypothetical protein
MKIFFQSLFLIACILVLSSGEAQVIGNAFPALTGETHDDQSITLPKDKLDKYTLIGMAYSKKSEKDLNTWFSPVYNKFIKKGGDGLFGAFSYDVHVFFVPMFTGVNGAATGAAKKKAAAKIDPRLLPHILFYKGKLKPYKEALDFEKKDVPYFFVVDKSGKIVYATSGKFTEDKLDEVEEALDE